MAKFWTAMLAASLLWAAAPVWAEEAGSHTRLVMPVVNHSGTMLVLDLDRKVTTPGRRYLDQGRSVTLQADDPARDGLSLRYTHDLIISQVQEGVEPWCRVSVHTANTAGRPGSLLTYCAAASTSPRCRLQVYNEAQVCWVLVTVR